MTLYTQKLGKEGENIAVAHLQKNGYSILARNYRSRRSEIDIIAQRDDILVFVEVKTRQSEKYGNPEISVTNSKIKMIAQGAEDYILEKDIHLECRYDIISIIKNANETKISHLEDAFWPGLY